MMQLEEIPSWSFVDHTCSEPVVSKGISAVGGKKQITNRKRRNKKKSKKLIR